MKTYNIAFSETANIDACVRAIESLGAEILVVRYRTRTATVRYGGDPADLRIENVDEIEPDRGVSAHE